MPLNIDSIRSFKPNQSILLNAQNQSLQKAGLGHSIGMYFKKSSAIARNEATVEAIRHAILDNPAYIGVKAQANELLDQIRTDVKINAAQIQTILQKLDALATPAEQRALLIERFTLHLAARDLPPGWAAQADRIRDYFDKRLDPIISATPQNAAHQVNVSIEIDNIINQLEIISTACTNEANELDQDTFKVLTAFFAKRCDAVDTREKVDALVVRIRETLAEARQLAEETPSVDFVSLASRFMTHIAKPAKAGVLTALNNAAKAALNDETVMTGLRAEGGLTVDSLDQALKNLFRAVNENIVYPEGVEMDDAYEISAAVNFVFRDVAASLSRQDQMALFDALTSDDGRNLRLFYEDIGSPETINTARAYDAMTEMLSTLLNRPIDTLDTEHLHANIVKIPLATRAQCSDTTLDPNLNTECKIAKFALDFAFNETQAMQIDTLAHQLIAGGNRAPAVLNALSNKNSPIHRMLAYPAICTNLADIQTAMTLLTTFDTVFNESTILSANDKARFKSMVEKFVFEEIAHAKETTGKLPNANQFKKELSNENHLWMNYAKWGMGHAESVRSLAKMPIKYRRPILSSLILFNNSNDISLFNRLVSKRDEILRLDQTNELTRENIFHTLVGNDVAIPQCFYGKSRDDIVKTTNYFNDQIFNAAMQRLIEMKKMDQLFTPTINLMMKFDISLDEALDILLNDLPRPTEAKKLNAFEPILLQPIYEDEVKTAEEQLAIDLHRITDGYVVNNVRANDVAPGSLFTFNLPDGTTPTYSSLPTPELEMTTDEKEDYDNGKPSPVSQRLIGAIKTLCGPMRSSQITSAILALAQGGISVLRNQSTAFGVVATEHSQACYNISRLDNGDLLIRISNPENCPLEFNWTYTIKPDGEAIMGEVQMRRVDL